MMLDTISAPTRPISKHNPIFAAFRTSLVSR